VYVIGGFRTAHRIQSCSTSRNPHLDSALDASEFIPRWIGWGFVIFFLIAGFKGRKRLFRDAKVPEKEKKIYALIHEYLEFE
ncbi:MAG: hypothetical protein U9N80_10605, partial [Chloroflexota bacterium]|nr:hypothetical protein [Chloroflexota bacterium]